MIARISGKLVSLCDNIVVLETNGLCYEILVPHIVGKALEGKPVGEPLSLETIYYLSVEQTRATPILIGFQNAIEKEFFQKLLTVPKVGPRAALNAFSRPVSTIARAIETADYALLQTLSGVGKQKARDLVAALQGKVAKFALMQDSDLDRRSLRAGIADVTGDALQMLLMLGHKRQEAERMISEAIKAEPTAPDAESLVRVIYRKQQEKR